MRACLALLPFDDQQLSVLSYATELSSRLDSHVSGLLVPPSQEIPAYLFDHAGLGVPHIPARDETADDGVRDGVLKAWAEAKTRAPGIGECEVLDSVNEEKANAIGRCSDLVLSLRPGTLASPGYDLLVRAAIMEGGAPVAVLPPGLVKQNWQVATVVWNGTLQSARAMRGSVPMLKSFDKVIVLRTRESAGDLAGSYLAAHDIEAETVDLKTNHSSARERGRRILEAARTHEADLIVMGAYSEGRVGRYLGFGGATEKVMTGAIQPVIFAR